MTKYYPKYWNIEDDEYDKAEKVINNAIVKLVDKSVKHAIKEYGAFIDYAIDVEDNDNTKLNFILYDSQTTNGTDFIKIPLAKFLREKPLFLDENCDDNTIASEQYLKEIKSLIPYIEECIKKQKSWIKKHLTKRKLK